MEDPSTSNGGAVPTKYADIVRKIKEDQLAAELKIAIFSAALLSYRRGSRVLPFPQHFVDKDGVKCMEHLQKTFDKLPPLEELMKATKELTEDEIVLLSWIIMDKTFQIRSCKHNLLQELQDKIAKASFPLQPNFVFEVKYLKNANSAKFDSLAQTYDVKHGYHGSRLDNFHSILHNGLQVHMTKNALYGEGVYLSEDLSVTMPYTTSGETWKHSILGEQLSCVAMCEIMDHPLVKCKLEKRSPSRARAKDSMGGDVPDKYFVVTNSELVRLKYVLVFAKRRSTKRKGKSLIFFRYPVASILVLYMAFLLLMGLCRSTEFQSFYKKHWVGRFFSTH